MRMLALSFAAGILMAARPYAAESEISLDGTVWVCAEQPHICYSQSGETYQWSAPLSTESLAAFRAHQKRQSAEAACVCSRETHGGGDSGTGIICTGAFDPYLLRKLAVDPCAGAWK